MDPTPTPDDSSFRKLDSGRGRGKHANHPGRALGVRNLRTREADEILKQLGHDAPHISLLKLGNDDKIELPMRVQMLAWAAPYFGSRLAPTPTPRFLDKSPGLGELTDAASALRFTARIAEQVHAGKLDTELAKFFANLAALYVNLLDKVAVETEVERHRELQVAAE
jgi:hypothetical protein